MKQLHCALCPRWALRCPSWLAAGMAEGHARVGQHPLTGLGGARGHLAPAACQRSRAAAARERHKHHDIARRLHGTSAQASRLNENPQCGTTQVQGAARPSLAPSTACRPCTSVLRRDASVWSFLLLQVAFRLKPHIQCQGLSAAPSGSSLPCSLLPASRVGAPLAAGRAGTGCCLPGSIWCSSAAHGFSSMEGLKKASMPWPPLPLLPPPRPPPRPLPPRPAWGTIDRDKQRRYVKSEHASHTVSSTVTADLSCLLALPHNQSRQLCWPVPSRAHRPQLPTQLP